MVNFPEDWGLASLGEVSRIRTGTRNRNEKSVSGRYPFFVRSAIIERIDSYSYDTEAVLVPGEGNIGSIFHYIRGKFDVHQRVYVISEFPDGVSGQFVFWYMKYLFGDHALENTSKATVDSLRLPVFRSFPLRLPQLNQQHAIAEVLSDFDEHLANLDELIVKKKVIRDGALEALTSGERRLDGFNSTWRTRPLSEFARVYDGVHQTPDYEESGVRFVSVEDISNIYASRKFISQSSYIKDFKVRPTKGDVLMTRIGDIGTPAYVRSDELLAYYVSLALLKPVGIDGLFLHYYIQSPGFQNELNDRSLLHATPKKINKGEIGFCLVTVPLDRNEQRAIAEVLSGMDAEIRLLEEERVKVERLKLGAMDDLLTGRVRLPIEEEAA